MNCLVSIAMLLQAFALGANHEATLDISVDWRFQSGTGQGWQQPDFDDSAWTPVKAGLRWEEQGYAGLDGHAWYRRTVDVPEAWKDRPVWLVLGAVNDTCVLYCNGTKVASFGDEKAHSFADLPVVADLTRVLKPGAANVLAVDVTDWGGSGGLWRAPCVLTTDASQLPRQSMVMARVDREQRQVLVDVGLGCLGDACPDSTLYVNLTAADIEEPVADASGALPHDKPTASVMIRVPEGIPMEGLGVKVAPRVGAPGQPDGPAVAGIVWDIPLEAPAEPRWPRAHGKVKILNNFVTQLLEANSSEELQTNLSFSNPRKGWVFISVMPSAGAVPPRARLNKEERDLVWRVNPDTKACEAMRLLPEGRHTLVLLPALPAHVSVRAIPELQFCYFPFKPHIGAYGSFDWPFMERHVLPHVNTLVTTGAPSEAFNAWLGEDRQWLANAGLPGLTDEAAPAVEDVFRAWQENPGTAQAGYGGLVVDEFVTQSAGHYVAWTDAVKRLYAAPEFKDRTFYAWYGTTYHQAAAIDLAQAVGRNGGMLVWERYLPEVATEEAVRWQFAHSLSQPWAAWRDSMPELAGNTVMCLGYMCAPPESLNGDPGVDYHVYMDMQFRTLATDPAFWGLYGLMEYSAAYADEESLRYAHQLFRHYAIEGRRDPFNMDPYRLPHVVNPDFANGLAGWTIVAAEGGRISIDSMNGFSFLQGRYPRTTQGDQFCRFSRSPKGPNRVMQTLKALTPGRLYSVKVIAADLQHLGDKPGIGPLSVEVKGAELLPDKSFQSPYASCYAHEVPPYTKAHPAWFTLYRVVFRATQAEAELSIADVREGQSAETAFNFVEVQPFH